MRHNTSNSSAASECSSTCSPDLHNVLLAQKASGLSSQTLHGKQLRQPPAMASGAADACIDGLASGSSAVHSLDQLPREVLLEVPLKPLKPTPGLAGRQQIGVI